MGTEHMIVAMVDRVLQLLDKPGMFTVVATAMDWMGAFDRLDPTYHHNQAGLPGGEALLGSHHHRGG